MPPLVCYRESMATEFGRQGEHGENSVGNKRDVRSSQQEQVDFDTARTILQTIVNTHESTITETTPLDRIAGFTTEQVRQAEKVIAQSIIEKHGVRSKSFDRTFLSK